MGNVSHLPNICLLNPSAKLSFLFPSLIFASVTVRCKVLYSVGCPEDFQCTDLDWQGKKKLQWTRAIISRMRS